MKEARRLRPVSDRPGAPEGGAPSGLSDENVIAGLRAGQEWAAEALYNRLHASVDRTLRRILQASDVDYDDLVQAAFERILQTLVRQRFAGACSLTTWASAIAGHVGIDALRARIRERKRFGHDRLDAQEQLRSVYGMSLDRQLEARSEIEQLQAILATMKQSHAETVIMHDLLGHELSEIAVLTGVSLAAAQSRLVRGRKDLMRRARLRMGVRP